MGDHECSYGFEREAHKCSSLDDDQITKVLDAVPLWCAERHVGIDSPDGHRAIGAAADLVETLRRHRDRAGRAPRTSRLRRTRQASAPPSGTNPYRRFRSGGRNGNRGARSEAAIIGLCVRETAFDLIESSAISEAIIDSDGSFRQRAGATRFHGANSSSSALPTSGTSAYGRQSGFPCSPRRLTQTPRNPSSCRASMSQYVIIAEQAQAYKPSREFLQHAYRTMGVTADETVHVAMGMRSRKERLFARLSVQ